MKAVALALLGLIVLGGAAMAGAAFLWQQPRTYTDTVLWIPQGTSTPQIANLAARNAKLPPLPVKAALRLTMVKPLQAGEYDLTDRPSLATLFGRMQNGQFIKRAVSIPEGLTSFQILRKLSEAYGLEPDCPAYTALAEGSLLPETYAYIRGEKCTTLLARMRAKMAEAEAALWPQRNPNVPYANWHEAVTMASIVERETGVAAERPRVAGVFVNRLRTGMPMQSDPTTIYGLSKGTGELGRELTRADWKIPNAYNTYTIPALPPGPIAHPGLASLKAALHPESHDYFFFVASGNGGHEFGKTLDDHIRNMQN